MFSVIFEVLPNKENWDDYFDNAKMLRPELEQVEGVRRQHSLHELDRRGLDSFAFKLAGREVARTLAHHKHHHEVQQKGRDEFLADYHLRVGQITADNQVPAGYALTEQRLAEPKSGRERRSRRSTRLAPRIGIVHHQYDCADWLGLDPWAADSTPGTSTRPSLRLAIRSSSILEGRHCSAGPRGRFRAE